MTKELREQIIRHILTAAEWREHIGAIKGESNSQSRQEDRLEGSKRVADLIMADVDRYAAEREKEARIDELRRRCEATATDLAKVVNGGNMFEWDWLVENGYITKYDLDRLAALKETTNE